MCQRFFTKAILSAAVMAACLAWTGTASAQTQSLFGNRGPAGQIGSNLNGSIVGGTTTFGAQSGASTGQTLGANQLGGAGAQGGFVGRDDNTGRFVGDQRQVTQQNQGGRGRQFGNRGGGNGATGRAFGDQFGGRGNQSSSRRIVRPRQEIAFTFRRPPTSQINSSIRLRFKQISLRQPALRNVLVVLDEKGAATLSGQVNSPETLRLAAIMVRLEPGVRSIKNELTVAESPASR
jgi:hypothetical protein